ncbi:hypothetical protein MHO82_15675 [Vibrio sp. Of7-15]|uniref:hypothetical protein n=1 Tax=Vibrio sp. Of7-15 TaxID=2724879 RepID=UPI001EF24E86|nr:hypothetical protein [Vibrio sp. Of7-15]MCG7498307.1 hypothetical protein [Vibrio sp. Of7-15]
MSVQQYKAALSQALNQPLHRKPELSFSSPNAVLQERFFQLLTKQKIPVTQTPQGTLSVSARYERVWAELLDQAITTYLGPRYYAFSDTDEAYCQAARSFIASKGICWLETIESEDVFFLLAERHWHTMNKFYQNWENSVHVRD